MAQIHHLITTLKKQLKLHSKTYTDVASALGISEASVKRLFAEESFSLQRLEAVCQLINLQISELVQLMELEQPQLQQLSEDQEREIVSDPLLLMVVVYVINHYPFQELLRHIAITESECVYKLTQLDRLNIIELLPNNRIKLLIAPNFRWLANGPIQRFFQQHVEKSFFQSNFNKADESLLVLNGFLSQASNHLIQKKLEQLGHEFNELIRQDAGLTPQERQGTTMVLAIRHWQYELFNRYRR